LTDNNELKNITIKTNQHGIIKKNHNKTMIMMIYREIGNKIKTLNIFTFKNTIMTTRNNIDHNRIIMIIIIYRKIGNKLKNQMKKNMIIIIKTYKNFNNKINN
jgi:hypothetical protein